MIFEGGGDIVYEVKACMWEKRITQKLEYCVFVKETRLSSRLWCILQWALSSGI